MVLLHVAVQSPESQWIWSHKNEKDPSGHNSISRTLRRMDSSANSTVKIILSWPESSSPHLGKEAVEYEILLELKDILLQPNRAQTQEIRPNSPAVWLVNTAPPNIQVRIASYTGHKRTFYLTFLTSTPTFNIFHYLERSL